MSLPWSDFYLALCSSFLFLSLCSLPGGQEQPRRLPWAWLFISPHEYYRSKGVPRDCSTPPLCPAHFTELFLWLSPPLDARTSPRAGTKSYPLTPPALPQQVAGQGTPPRSTWWRHMWGGEGQRWLGGSPPACGPSSAGDLGPQPQGKGRQVVIFVRTSGKEHHHRCRPLPLAPPDRQPAYASRS